jgi:hypothetical protein
MKSNSQHLSRTPGPQQQRTVDLTRQETARLPVPLSGLQRLDRLVPVEDQFRMTVRDHALRRGIFAIVFKNPIPIDRRAEPRRRPDFTVPNHLGMIARVVLSFRYTVLAMDTLRAAYDEVYVYTMGRPGFILQHVVDAFAVQTADENTKPIAVVFGLVGLYLHVEEQFSGRQVQEAHMKLGRARRQWPRIHLPEERGSICVVDVLAAPPGPERDTAIDEWCRSVWTAFAANRQTIVALCVQP